MPDDMADRAAAGARRDKGSAREDLADAFGQDRLVDALLAGEVRVARFVLVLFPRDW
jgi:hypothetical protein